MFMPQRRIDFQLLLQYQRVNGMPGQRMVKSTVIEVAVDFAVSREAFRCHPLR